MECISNEEYSLILNAIFEKYVKLEKDSEELKSEELKDEFMLSEAFHNQSQRYYRIWRKLAYGDIKIVTAPEQ